MWIFENILCLRPSAASRWSAPSQVKGRGFETAPFSSSAMSLGLGIPWQVALQQSLPPLPQPEPVCNDKDSSVEQFSADGACLTDSVSQTRPQSTNHGYESSGRRTALHYDGPLMNAEERGYFDALTE